jgi:replicative DNA helicase
MREPTRTGEETEAKYNDRYEAWTKRLERAHGLSEIIIAKQRHGPIGTVKLHFDAETTKFDNYIDPDHLPAER